MNSFSPLAAGGKHLGLRLKLPIEVFHERIGPAPICGWRLFVHTPLRPFEGLLGQPVVFARRGCLQGQGPATRRAEKNNRNEMPEFHDRSFGLSAKRKISTI